MERLILNNILEINNLSKSFGGVRAVEDADFTIETEKITALIGPNGSGKTTVFNLISGLLSCDSGKIIFDGQDITDLSIEEGARLGISRVFQGSRLFNNLSAKENLLIAVSQKNFDLFRVAKATPEERKRIKEILDLFELTEKSNYPVKELSFGQKRLIEIARAYLMPHKLLLLDEPVAGVTPYLRGEIHKFLDELRKKGETVLIIEHDMNFVFGIADEIVVMDAGKILIKGSSEEIKGNAKVKEAYLGE